MAIAEQTIEERGRVEEGQGKDGEALSRWRWRVAKGEKSMPIGGWQLRDMRE
jgi:hypothetical protein